MTPTPESSRPKLKFCILAHGDVERENVLYVLNSAEERDIITIELIYGQCPLPNQKTAEIWDKEREELNDTGELNFEGDPGLRWFVAIESNPNPARQLETELAAALARKDKLEKENDTWNPDGLNWKKLIGVQLERDTLRAENEKLKADCFALKCCLGIWDCKFQKYQSWIANRVPAKDFPRQVVEDYQYCSKVSNKAIDAAIEAERKGK